MALDSNDNLIVGTEPGGLVLRVSPAGDGFVLYQMAKKEVTAVAVAADGSIYAAGGRQQRAWWSAFHRRLQRRRRWQPCRWALLVRRGLLNRARRRLLQPP